MISIAVTVFAVAAPLMAQEEEEPPMSVAMNYLITVNPGQGLEFEAAYRGHMEWHAIKNDTWYWGTWQIVSGARLGQYIVHTGNHPFRSIAHSTREVGKRLLGKLGDRRYRIHALGTLTDELKLRDGRRVHEFIRYSRHPKGIGAAGTAHGLASSISGR